MRCVVNRTLSKYFDFFIYLLTYHLLQVPRTHRKIKGVQDCIRCFINFYTHISGSLLVYGLLQDGGIYVPTQVVRGTIYILPLAPKYSIRPLRRWSYGLSLFDFNLLKHLPTYLMRRVRIYLASYTFRIPDLHQTLLFIGQTKGLFIFQRQTATPGRQRSDHKHLNCK